MCGPGQMIRGKAHLLRHSVLVFLSWLFLWQPSNQSAPLFGCSDHLTASNAVLSWFWLWLCSWLLLAKSCWNLCGWGLHPAWLTILPTAGIAAGLLIGRGGLGIHRKGYSLLRLILQSALLQLSQQTTGNSIKHNYNRFLSLNWISHEINCVCKTFRSIL